MALATPGISDGRLNIFCIYQVAFLRNHNMVLVRDVLRAPSVKSRRRASNECVKMND